ncbi:uncharacterized protein OCT59_014784 [Rhizophagus irregularis]|uniref:uncharacterized protein n=1 Tax=Rhizophagus irregularis TaxID=588596 RepID=UPI0033189DC0|nr:hypothetical protein OCT59_014784 [Rhizophagus irregularis]
MEPIDDFGGSGWNLSIILEFRVPDRTIKDFGIQRFVMEPIKDIGIQRFWIEPIKDIGIRRFQIEPIKDIGIRRFRMEPIKDFGIQRFQIEPIKDIGIRRFWIEPIKDFGIQRFFCFGLWRRKVLRFLDFEDDGYQRPLLWIGIGETLSRFGKILHFGSSIGCDLWILGIDWHQLGHLDSCDLWKPVHQLGPLDRYRLRPLETCGIGCDLWILGIDWHWLGHLDRYRLQPLETCGIGCDLWKPVVSIS